MTGYNLLMSKKSSKEGFIVSVLAGAAAAVVGYVLFKDEIENTFSNKSKKTKNMARYPKVRKKGRPEGTGTQTDRIRKILGLASEKKRFSLSDIRHRFPKVTERTLRRDMEKLVRDGRLAKEGTTRSTIYVKK